MAGEWCRAGRYCCNAGCPYLHPDGYDPNPGMEFSHGQQSYSSYSSYPSYAEDPCFDDQFFPEFQDCSCCKGFIYACADYSTSCAMLGACGCSYDPEQDGIEFKDQIPEDYDHEQDTIEEIDQIEQAEEMYWIADYLQRRDEWHPISQNCECCKGFIYNCKSPICKSLSRCSCSLSYEQMYNDLRKVPILAAQHGNYFPRSVNEIEKMPVNDYRKQVEEIRIKVIKNGVLLPAPDHTASNLIQLVLEFPECAAVICHFFKDWLLGVVIKGEKLKQFQTVLYQLAFTKMLEEKDKRELMASIPCYLAPKNSYAKLGKYFEMRAAAKPQGDVKEPEWTPEEARKWVNEISSFDDFIEKMSVPFPYLLPSCFAKDK